MSPTCDDLVGSRMKNLVDRSGAPAPASGAVAVAPLAAVRVLALPSGGAVAPLPVALIPGTSFSSIPTGRPVRSFTGWCFGLRLGTSLVQVDLATAVDVGDLHLDLVADVE